MNNFAIETVQSLFENVLNVPQSKLGTTVMRRSGSLSPEIWCFECRNLHGNSEIVSVWTA